MVMPEYLTAEEMEKAKSLAERYAFIMPGDIFNPFDIRTMGEFLRKAVKELTDWRAIK